MMIANVLRSLGTFHEQDVERFTKAIVRRIAAKDEILLREGEVCQTAYFLVSGACWQFTAKNELDHNVIDLHLPNEWVLNHQSFTAQQPSEYSICAFSEATLWELNVRTIHALIDESPAFLQLGKILGLGAQRVRFYDNNSTPLEKYQTILRERPSLLQHFPLKVIASYLKITPETLSRVREQIAKAHGR